MEQPWLSLVPLHVALPLVGAALFLMACRRGPAAARAMVIINAGVSVLLAAVLIGAYLTADAGSATEPEPGTTSFRIPWLSLPAGDVPPSTADAVIALSFGVDGVSLWFLATVPLLVLCVLLTDPAEKWCEQPLPVAALLIGESAALALFVASDVVLFSAALGVLALANCVAVGSRGGPGVRTAARRLALQHLVAAALITISLAGTAAACAHMRGAPHSPPQPTTFDLDELIHDIRRLTGASPPAQIVWRQLSPWLFLSLFAGCWIWSGGFPFHIATASAIRSADPAGRALLGGVTLKAGAWGLIRVALPLYPDLMGSLGPFLLLGAILSALYCAVSMNAARVMGESCSAPDPRSDGSSFLAEGAVVVSLLSMCGALSQSITGVVGGTLLLVAHMVCWMFYVRCAGGSGDNLLSAPPGERGASRLALLALAGIPGLALFPGLLLLSLGLSASPVTVESWLAVLLLYWLVIAMSGWAHLDQARTATPAPGPSTRGARVVAVLLVGAILLIGIAPGLFTAPVYDGVLELLHVQDP